MLNRLSKQIVQVRYSDDFFGTCPIFISDVDDVRIQRTARHPNNSFRLRCTTSRIGGAPNSRLYSRLNCDALS